MELERYKHQKKTIMCFKPHIDDRYSVDEIVSHSGWKTPARCVKSGADVLGILADIDVEPHVIAVDEAFMIPGISSVLLWLYSKGFDVIVSTLDLSAKGKPFAEVEKLLSHATHLHKCTAVCTVCGRDAPYTHKKQLGGDDIEVGGAELYEPRCFSHHLAIDQRSQIGDD